MNLALIGWVGLAILGFLIALGASRRVANHATELVATSNVSPFVVGLVLLAVGTDIPEIVNSFITSAAGHGDLNVGDSIGSTVTQLTLVLGIIAFVASPIAIDSRAVQAVGSLCVTALFIGVLLMGDGTISRIDAIILVGGWVLATALTRNLAPEPREHPRVERVRRRLFHIGAALFFLTVVAAGAGAAVRAMIGIAEALEVPEYAISFFGASIGTSLPELIVDVTAIRRGAAGLALGDVFGSSLVDATLSVGIGPLFFPILVDASAAVRGSLFAAVAVALVTMLLAFARTHNRMTGAVLIAIYAASYVVVLR